jgi:hypothetical protein
MNHDEVLGFSREARVRLGDAKSPGGGGRGGWCLGMMVALTDEMEAEGFAGNVDERTQESRRRCTEVAGGDRPCPLAGACDRYRRAIARGGNPIHKGPVQLGLALG